MDSITKPDAGTFVHLLKVRARNSRAASVGEGVVNLSHGGMRRGMQHPMVKDAIQQGVQGRTFLGFLKHNADQEELPLLDYLKRFRPPEYFCDLESAYRYRYIKAMRRKGRDVSDQGFVKFLDTLARTEIPLEHYPPETLGDLECRSIMRQYFVEQGLPAHDSLVIFGGYGFRSLYFASLAAVFTELRDGRKVSKPGTLLTCSPFFHGTVGYPSIFGVSHKTFDAYDERELSSVFRSVEGRKILLLFSVGNPDGRILDRGELTVIAREVLTYNRDHPGQEVTVVSDENYRGSVLGDELDDTPSIGAIGIEGLGRMHDCTVTITSPSKTFALASARVGMATSGDRALLVEMATWLRQIGAYHIFNPAVLGATAAFACTPRSWVAGNNSVYKDSIEKVKRYVDAIDQTYPGLVSLNEPQGGWYLLLKLDKRQLPESIRPVLRSSNDLHIYLMYYGKRRGERTTAPDTGVVTFPSSIVTHSTGTDDEIIWVRFTVAEPDEVLREAFRRIHDALERLRFIEVDYLREILAFGEETAEHGYEYQLGDAWDDRGPYHVSEAEYLATSNA